VQPIGANIRRYGEDYVARLEEAGFEVQFVPYVRELDRATIERHALEEVGGRMTGNDIYLSTKPAP
jgi:predicted fused transcriptional regulator/phosphomethylpyrimidine kinase